MLINLLRNIIYGWKYDFSPTLNKMSKNYSSVHLLFQKRKEKLSNHETTYIIEIFSYRSQNNSGLDFVVIANGFGSLQSLKKYPKMWFIPVLDKWKGNTLRGVLLLFSEIVD